MMTYDDLDSNPKMISSLALLALVRYFESSFLSYSILDLTLSLVNIANAGI